LKRPLNLVAPMIAALALLVPSAGSASSSAGAERALDAAEKLFVGGPGAASAGAPGREATLVLRDLVRALPKLSAGDRRRASEILARPVDKNDPEGDYFGKEAQGSPICDGHFCVHWSKKARNAPAAIDGDASGVPDFPEAVLAAAATSYAIENATLGWRDAKSDGNRGARNGRGGAGQVDIYLLDLGRQLFGYATTDARRPKRTESGYLVMDNDYKGFGGNPLELMQATMAHEYNHVLQFNYDVYLDDWMFESTATWMEEMVYPEINDYLRFTKSFSRFPWFPMAEPRSAGVKIYGSALWNHWLNAKLGAATIREAWAAGPAVRPRDFAVAAYDRAIGGAGGSSFSRQFAAFATATAEINADPAFPDAGMYEKVRRSGRIKPKPRKLQLNHTAYRLYRVRATGTAKLIAKVQRGTHSAIALVGRRGAATGGDVEIASRYLAKGGRAKVELPDAEGYDKVTAVLVNADGRVRGASRNYTRDGRRFKARIG
jgi:hypothetical protein